MSEVQNGKLNRFLIFPHISFQSRTTNLICKPVSTLCITISERIRHHIMHCLFAIKTDLGRQISRYTTTTPTLKKECVRCVPVATCVCQMKQIRQKNIAMLTTLGTLATDFYKKLFSRCDNNQFINLRPEKSGLQKIPCILAEIKTNCTY